MFGTFYLATYNEQYKLPHKTRHKTAGEPHQLPPPLKLFIQSGALLWKICVRALAVH